MNVKQEIDKDLKVALLAGDKLLTETLRGVKSAVLYAEVASNKRDHGLSEEETINVLQREAKKRQESADLYEKGGDSARRDKELAEKKIISKYLPEQLSKEEVETLVSSAEKEMGGINSKNIGQAIAWVKQNAKGGVDGAAVATIVKGRLKE